MIVFHKIAAGMLVFAVVVMIMTIIVESILLGLIGVMYVKSYERSRKKK